MTSALVLAVVSAIAAVIWRWGASLLAGWRGDLRAAGRQEAERDAALARQQAKGAADGVRLEQERRAAADDSDAAFDTDDFRD